MSIGFLAYRYGPVVTTSGGGLKGTGVPLTLRKWNPDHAVNATPTAINGIDTGSLAPSGKKARQTQQPVNPERGNYEQGSECAKDRDTDRCQKRPGLFGARRRAVEEVDPAFREFP